MKARVKATGYIVEVIKDYDLRESTVVEFYTNIEDPTDVFEKEELEFSYDSEFIDYWTRLEHQAAISAMNALLLTNNIRNGYLEGMRECNTNAMAIAYALIQKLKEKEERKGKEMKFNSAICTTREQSERLIALGLKKETADMVWTHAYYGTWVVTPLENPLYEESDSVPAWSLHRLIEMMPKCVRAHSSGDDSPRLHPYVPKFDYQGVTIENIDEILADFYEHTDLFDNIIDCIEWLIKEGHFGKEYLEE